ncbi:MAG: CCA tRNA nucleotidyltransferase [Oscillospiraceae bacterium]
MTGIPGDVRRTLQTLTAAGHQAYLVGGCVRDMLRGVPPLDWDAATDAAPEEVMALFGGSARPTGLRHGTVTVLCGSLAVEVTTYREDGAYADHRHPEAVRFTSSLSSDLRRRDFTVNAMAMDLEGRLVDEHGGQADLAAGLLRCVGRAEERFEEDALRILRCLRFASVLGFSVEEETARAMVEKRALLPRIAGERLREETTKLLCGGRACEVLLAYPQVLGAFIPELLPSVGFDHRNPHHCYDVWEHTAHAVEGVPPEPLLRWVMLLHDLGKPSVCFYDASAGKARFRGHQLASVRLAEGVLERLRFDTESKKRILLLVEHHDQPMEPAEKPMRRLLRRFGEEDLRALIAIRRADNLAQHPDYRGLQKDLTACEAILEKILREGQCFSLKQLRVDGNELLALGLRGREVGETLERLLTAVVEGELPNDREALLAAARKEM